MDNKELTENLNFTSDVLSKYKAIENNKIIQFFHMTMLVIVAILSRATLNNIAIISLVFSIIFMIFSYAFFFIYDRQSFTVRVHSYLDGKAGKNLNQNPKIILLSMSVKECLLYIALGVVLAYIGIITAIISLANLSVVSHCCAIICAVFAIIIIIIFGKSLVKNYMIN